MCQSRRLTNGGFLPRHPPTILHVKFASAEGASEDNLESTQQSLAKKLQNSCKITCIARLRQPHRLTNRVLPRLPPTIMHMKFERRGASEEDWNLDKRTWSKSCKMAAQVLHSEILPVAEAHVTSGCFFDASVTKTFCGNFASAKGVNEENFEDSELCSLEKHLESPQETFPTLQKCSQLAEKFVAFVIKIGKNIRPPPWTTIWNCALHKTFRKREERQRNV